MKEKELAIIMKRANALVDIYLHDDMRRQFIDTLMNWLSIADNNIVLLEALASMMDMLSNELKHLTYTANAKNN